MWVEQDSLHSRMKGKEHRDQFAPGEPPDVPTLPKRQQGEEFLGRLLRGEHRQYLFAQVRKDVGQLQALANMPDYQIALKQRVLLRIPRLMPVRICIPWLTDLCTAI